MQNAESVTILLRRASAIPRRAGNWKERTPLTTIAAPRARSRRVPEPVSQRPDASETLRLILARLDDMKAEDTVTIDLHGKSSIADYMVVASGTSNRHVGSVADRVIRNLETAGVKQIRVVGARQNDWVLIDAGDVIVHVFRPEVRDFYNLEKMWMTGQSRGRKAS